MKLNIILGSMGFLILVGLLSFAYFVMPDSFLYPLKRWEEKMILTIKKNPSDGISYNLYLLNRRLIEVADVAQKKEYPLFYPTSLRFASLAGDIMNTSIANEKLDKLEILSTFKTDTGKIEKILLHKDSTEEWKYIHDDINYLSIYSSKFQ